jgi:signal transduction histidine kinase
VCRPIAKGSTMLSLPGIKGLMKTLDNRRQSSDIDLTSFVESCEPANTDMRSYLIRLAAQFHIEVLALIELQNVGKTAEVTAAGRKGSVCDLALPTLDGKGLLSKLITEAKATSGRGRVFARQEVFPSDGAWCDVVPMDSAVSFAFLPVDKLQIGASHRSKVLPEPPPRFILAINDDEAEDNTTFSLKTLACASLVGLFAAAIEAQRYAQVVDAMTDLLEREGYSLCCVDEDGRTLDATGGLLNGAQDAMLSEFCLRAASLDVAGQGAPQPRDLTGKNHRGMTAFAYDLLSHEGRTTRMVAVRRDRSTPEYDSRSEKFRLLSRFMSSIAHEIKNPLTGIAAGVQYLAKKLQPGLAEDETVEFILAEINRLNRIVDDLYKIAKPPELVLQPVRINDVIAKSLLCLSEDILKKRLTVRQDLQDDIPEFEADADRLQQILINIVKNAIEATPEKSNLSVETTKTGSSVHIRVTDSGPGISDEAIERVFEPFYSTKQGGTGLGLCISQRIVDEHGGRIFIERPGGGGTSFVIELPLRG